MIELCCAEYDGNSNIPPQQMALVVLGMHPNICLAYSAVCC